MSLTHTLAAAALVIPLAYAQDGSSGETIVVARKVEEIFEVDDEVTEAIVAALQPALRRAEAEHARRASPDDLTAEELVEIAHRGLTLARLFNLRSGFTRADDTLPRRFREAVTPPEGSKSPRRIFDELLAGVSEREREQFFGRSLAELTGF